MSVKVIDGYAVNPIESLKAEWLFSQGKGRSFRVGEQQALAQYLSQTCSLSGEALENEDERKLRLILSKAQQHQRQLKEESPTGTPNSSSTNNSPSTNRRKGPSRIQSPRVSRLSGQHHRPMTADAVMSSSFHGSSTSSPSHNDSHNHSSHLLDMTKSLIENFTSDTLMTQSLDPTILLTGSSMNTSMNSSMTSSIMVMKDSHPSPTHNGNLYNEQSHIPVLHSASGPLVTASKMMPVPESLMSPDCCPSSVIPTSQQQTRPLSGLTTSTSNTTTTTVRTTKIVQQQQQQPRPSSSPATITKGTTRIATKKSEKLSPSNSPRKALKAMMNTANTKIHQNQSILKNSHQTQQQQHPNISHQQEEFIPLNKTALSSVATTEDEDEDECDKVNEEKLKSIKKVAQKNQKQMENQINKASVENKEAEKSAIMIQKMWRGYNTRKQNNGDIANALQQKRTNDYILKLAQDMEMTKQALENERKIQQLQMQAINALWKKVSSMQVDNAVTSENGGGMGDSANSNIVHDLTKTCSVLTNQVQQLQLSMRDIVNCVSVFSQLPMMQSTSNSGSSMTNSQFRDSSETQTEIIAVHTPQIDHPKEFPFVMQKVQRPCSLPINSSSNDSSVSTRSSQNNTATTGDEEAEKAIDQVAASAN